MASKTTSTNRRKRMAEIQKEKFGYTKTITIILTGIAMAIVLLAIIGNFVLSWNGKVEHVLDLGTITTWAGGIVLGVWGGYVSLTGVRNTSLNKTHRAQIQYLKDASPVEAPQDQQHLTSMYSTLQNSQLEQENDA